MYPPHFSRHPLISTFPLSLLRSPLSFLSSLPYPGSSLPLHSFSLYSPHFRYSSSTSLIYPLTGHPFSHFILYLLSLVLFLATCHMSPFSLHFCPLLSTVFHVHSYSQCWTQSVGIDWGGQFLSSINKYPNTEIDPKPSCRAFCWGSEFSHW